MPDLLRNPYDFVPLEDGPQRSTQPAGLHTFTNGLTGEISCRLTVLTPLMIGTGDRTEDQRQAVFHPARVNGEFVIPASALKGMLRSVVEVASNSCMSALSRSYPGLGEFDTRRARGYAPCEDLDQLCPACAMFGMVETKERSGEEAKGALAGRIWLTAARLTSSPKRDAERIALPGRFNAKEGNIAPIGSPKPGHESFYFDASGNCLGRKFYYRSARWQAMLDQYRKTYKEILSHNYRTIILEAAPQDTLFEFTVHFVNLSEIELDYLLYGLCLESGICHHLGYGKPFGLGSVRIEAGPIRLRQKAVDAPGPAYLLRYDDGSVVEVQRPGFEERVWGNRPHAPAVRKKLREILTWPRDEIFFYPDYNWFRDPKKSRGVTLAQYQAGVRTSAMAAPSTPKASPAGRLRGRVEKFEGGRGFIRAENGERVFVRFSEIRGTGYRNLDVGDTVEFEVRMEDRGPRAYDVVVIPPGGRR